ncbi:Hydrolase, haloacid dehalogenase-like family [hydrothermal vent metagenome]|uniref:Hydrolase, haloacid dehalogenase-like family n=1 Tax=hydrothermal vent metagenome TaxID=652676 RepID=A0A3B0RKI7_9ZZZZ
MGNVLYRWDLRCLFEKLIGDSDELDWFLNNVVTPEWHFQHDAGRPLAEMVPELIKKFPEYQSCIIAYSTRFNETIPGPVEGALEIVQQLATKNIAIYGITNFGAEFWQGFHPTAPVFKHFTDIIVSGEEKMTKPHPAIYQLALNRFDRIADQCLFIDDRKENIVGGEQAGIRGHLFETADALEAELIALNLL